MPVLLAAPDKFRGSASASDLAAAAGRSAARLGWTCEQRPLSDGGEGFVDALGGDRRTATVHGPLGTPVAAIWTIRSDLEGATAYLESASAAGLALIGDPGPATALEASTAGVGELILAAAEAGARRIVVGCGGSATTDGGSGALEAIGGRERLFGIDVVAAYDVSTPFLRAGEVFAPQKGADPATVELLTRRLEAIAASYETELGVDVRRLRGGGAAGGLAGGLAAIGARLVPGFEVVAGAVGLDAAIRRADLVVTGEGRLDATSFSGKVVGALTAVVRPPEALIVITGSADRTATLPDGATLVVLSERYGMERAGREPVELFGEVVAEQLRRWHR